MLNFPYNYENGNAKIYIASDGTREIECDGDLKLDYPLNIDVRLSRRCSYGMNPNGKSVCDFCHESATTDGKDATLADIRTALDYFDDLPRGTEIAVGINQFTDATEYFLNSCHASEFIVNATVNQGHVRKNLDVIRCHISKGTINGLGISYRAHAQDIPDELLEYKNMVVHVIAGIDSIDEIKELAAKGVKKLLVLGEKDFGFNFGKVKLVSESHRDWYKRVHEIFKLFDVVSFDNLALEQLNIKRFVKDWDTMYQHEFSFYVNIVDGTFSPSSRSNDVVSMMNIKEYFQNHICVR